MPTPEILTSLGQLGGVVIVVLLFLKHISKASELESKRSFEHVERMKDVCDDFVRITKMRKDELIDCVGLNTKAINENSKVLGGTTIVLTQAAEALRDSKK